MIIVSLSLAVDLLIALAMLIFGVALAMIVAHFDKFTIISFMESLPTGLLCACYAYLYAPGTCYVPSIRKEGVSRNIPRMKLLVGGVSYSSVS